jgi:hypothetical protein
MEEESRGRMERIEERAIILETEQSKSRARGAVQERGFRAQTTKAAAEERGRGWTLTQKIHIGTSFRLVIKVSSTKYTHHL